MHSRLDSTLSRGKFSPWNSFRTLFLNLESQKLVKYYLFHFFVEYACQIEEVSNQNSAKKIRIMCFQIITCCRSRRSLRKEIDDGVSSRLESQDMVLVLGRKTPPLECVIVSHILLNLLSGFSPGSLLEDRIWSEHYSRDSCNLNIPCRFSGVYFQAAGCATKANSISIVPLSRMGDILLVQTSTLSGRFRHTFLGFSVVLGF